MTTFADKLVLITGASSGIGKQLAYDFAAQGARLLLVARREERLRAVALEIERDGGWAHFFVCDLAQRSQRDTLVEQIKTEHGIPDILVNNAGYGNYRLFLHETPDEITRIMEVNYTAAAQLLSAFLPGMIQRGFGAIVNISSGAGRVALPFMAAYCAAKFALGALTEAVSYELAGTGVTIHLVNPGPVDTEFFDAGVWEGKKPIKTASPEQVSLTVRESILNNRLIAYVPARRGILAYVYNLLGPLGRGVMRRKFLREVKRSIHQSC